MVSANGGRKLSRRIRWPIIGAILLFLAGTFYLFHPALLRSAGNFLIIQDVLVPSDAIVLSTGDLFNRPSVAALLYHQRLARLVLISCTERNLAEKFDIIPDHASLLKMVLVKYGVPDSAIIILSMFERVTSTYDEARNVKTYLTVHWARRSIIVVTSAFHTRRAALTYRKVMGDSGIRVLMAPAPYTNFDVQQWWKYEDGLIFFLNEYIKLLYYWWKY